MEEHYLLSIQLSAHVWILNLWILNIYDVPIDIMLLQSKSWVEVMQSSCITCMSSHSLTRNVVFSDHRLHSIWGLLQWNCYINIYKKPTPHFLVQYLKHNTFRPYTKSWTKRVSKVIWTSEVPAEAALVTCLEVAAVNGQHTARQECGSGHPAQPSHLAQVKQSLQTPNQHITRLTLTTCIYYETFDGPI